MEPNFYKFIPVLKNNLSGNKSKKERKGGKEGKQKKDEAREGGKEKEGNRYCNIISIADTLFMVLIILSAN